MFGAVVYLMLFLCLICFDISAQFPGHFFYFLDYADVPKKNPKELKKIFHDVSLLMKDKICHWILMHIFQIIFTPTNEKLFQVKQDSVKC